MAGVLLHLAMGDPQKTDPDNTAYNASFKKAYTLGLLLPDIAKRGFIRLNRCIEDEYGVLARTRQILSAPEQCGTVIHEFGEYQEMRWIFQAAKV